MNVRKNNAEYDELIGDQFDKCDWCLKIIDGKKHELINPSGLNTLNFCSPKHRSMFIYMLKNNKTESKRVLEDSHLYEQLKKKMTKKYEEIREKRGF